MEKKSFIKAEDSENQYKTALEILRDVTKDSTVAKQRKALETVQKTICHAIENDRNMALKSRKLRSEISANSSKIRAAIQLSEEDKSTISMLKEELEKAWETIKELKSSNKPFSRTSNEYLFSIGNGTSCNSPNESLVIDSSNNRKLQKEISRLKEEKKNLLHDAQSLKTKLDEQEHDSKHLKEENKNLLLEFTDMKKIREELQNKVELHLENMKTMESDLATLKKENDRLTTENEKGKLQIFELEEELANKEKRLEELTTVNINRDIGSVVSEMNKGRENQIAESGDATITALQKSITKKQRRKIKIMASQLVKMSDLYKANRINLNQQKRQLHEVVNTLNSTKIKKDLLDIELEEKARENYILVEQISELKSEIDKASVSIELLEEIRDDYVSSMGKLENEVHMLKAELTQLDNRRYLNTIDGLNKDIFSLKSELEKERKALAKQKLIQNINEQEIGKLKELEKKMEDTLQIYYNSNNKSIRRCFEEINSISSSSITKKKLQSYGKCGLDWNLKEKHVALIEYFCELARTNDQLNEEIKGLKKENSDLNDTLRQLLDSELKEKNMKYFGNKQLDIAMICAGEDTDFSSEIEDNELNSCLTNDYPFNFKDEYGTKSEKCSKNDDESSKFSNTLFRKRKVQTICSEIALPPINILNSTKQRSASELWQSKMSSEYKKKNFDLIKNSKYNDFKETGVQILPKIFHTSATSTETHTRKKQTQSKRN